MVKIETRILKATKEDLTIAANIIKNGGIVAFPTETVYGLGADALNKEAVAKIFEAKGRPADNPLIIHIDSFEKIYNYIKKIPTNAKKLADNFWPGPMTLVLEKNDIIPNIVSARLETVGVRLPADETARCFIEMTGTVIAAPSANLSGSPSPTRAEDVISDMTGKVDAIIVGSDCEVGLESTVINVTKDIPKILRPGAITPDMIKSICGEISISEGIDGVEKDAKVASPGMKYRHYAPKCKLVIAEGEEDVKRIIQNCNIKETVIICTKQSEKKYKDLNIIVLGDLEKPETMGKNLFTVFRKCDKMNYKLAVIEAIPETGIGIAIMNRIKRATHD